MMKLHRKYVEGINQIAQHAELHFYLQKAIELEHSTIPPYLTAMFSLKPDSNQEIARLIRQIVMQEMLHMTIVANIMIAIGGRPNINKQGFVPQYPGNLPMEIGGKHFIVGIEAFSKELVEEIFMVIESPDSVIPPSLQRVKHDLDESYHTIGDFYDALKKKLRHFGDSIFQPERVKDQVLSWFPPAQLFAITNVETACAAIDIIVTQGEGSATSPFEGADGDTPNDPAHYYKFAEISRGRKITPNPPPYSFNGEPIPFHADGVYPLRANCKIDDYAVGTQARTRIEGFAYSYSSLLNALHDTFNGNPANIDTAIGLMYSMKMEAVALMQTPDPTVKGLTVGPSYEFVHTQGGMG